MENISLELLRNQSFDKNESAAEGNKTSAAEINKGISDFGQEITAEDRKRIDEIKANLNLLESGQTITFGVGAQRKLSEFSDIILDQMNYNDTTEAGQLLIDLLGAVEDLGIEELGETGGFLSRFPFFSAENRNLKRLKLKYEKIEINIDRIEGQLDQTRIQILKNISMLDELYSRNFKYFRELQLHIKAGEELIDEIRKKSLPELRAEAKASGDLMFVQLVSDFENTVVRFEKKIYDLKLSQTMSIQTAAQIKLVQNNDKILAEKIQSVIMNTIPLWKNQIIIALGLARQENALNIQRNISKATKKIVTDNSGKIKKNTIAAAKESEKGIIELETLKIVNNELIETINDTLKIQQDGHVLRNKAENELQLLEEDMKTLLLFTKKD
ncbi:MAG: toxic anion resistance protein [Clostridiales bacterium]|nr:toxic anion resistance protein [Clostridiales bacterium]